MRYLDVLLEYKTKDGRNITFDIIEDEEGDNNRGFKVDHIDAYVDGEHAGYLALTYIPKERFINHYPSILNWLDKMQGKSLFPYKREDLPWQQLSPDEMRETIKSYYLYHRSFGGVTEDSIGNLSDDEAQDMMAKVEQHATENYGDQYKGFYNYFVDKPFEDFIRVFSAGETMGRRGQGEQSKNTFTRQGIATALYFKAVDFYTKKGLQVRLSTLRSAEGGQAIGDALMDAGLTTPGKPFKYNGKTQKFQVLDPAKVKAYQKEHGISESLCEKVRTPEEELKHYEEIMQSARNHIESPTANPGEQDNARRIYMVYKKKADALRDKIAKEKNKKPEAEPVADFMPDFGKGEPPRRYTRKGEFEPLFKKTGTRYDTTA